MERGAYAMSHHLQPAVGRRSVALADSRSAARSLKWGGKKIIPVRPYLGVGAPRKAALVVTVNAVLLLLLIVVVVAVAVVVVVGLVVVACVFAFAWFCCCLLLVKL